MSRCRACNNAMTEKELLRFDKISNDYSELCGYCLRVSNGSLDEDIYFDYPTLMGTLDEQLEESLYAVLNNQ